MTSSAHHRGWESPSHPPLLDVCSRNLLQAKRAALVGPNTDDASRPLGVSRSWELIVAVKLQVRLSVVVGTESDEFQFTDALVNDFRHCEVRVQREGKAHSHACPNALPK